MPYNLPEFPQVAAPGWAANFFLGGHHPPYRAVHWPTMPTDIIEFTSLVNTEDWDAEEDAPDHTNVITISMQALVDFLRAPQQTVVFVDGVPMEFRYAADLMLAAQHYYIEHYPTASRAFIRAQGLEPDF